LDQEEQQETAEAIATGDFVEFIDGLADQVYILFGTALECGVNLQLVLEEVHRSNMSKLDENGKPIIREDGKVLKGPNYFKPDIRRVLIEQGWTPPEA
jgi:predicted HAD superfamily Cof-like phosphohydrolase